jgi:hypothetical protein
VHCYIYIEGNTGKCSGKDKIPPTLAGYMLPAYIAEDYKARRPLDAAGGGDVEADLMGEYTSYRALTKGDSCETECCIRSQARKMAEYRIQNYSHGGLNSNTYAEWLLRSCESTAFPQSAPGWGNPKNWQP